MWRLRRIAPDVGFIRPHLVRDLRINVRTLEFSGTLRGKIYLLLRRSIAAYQRCAFL